MSTVKARLNAVLPHSGSQLLLLFFLIDALYGRDAAFTAAYDRYLAEYSAERTALRAGAS